MDFGVARLSGHTMTADGNIVGTADYMSPEQVQGKPVDPRSDLFSVGCMLFELAAGRRPFHSDNLMAIFYKITHEEANFDLIPQGAEYDALMPILKKALAKNSDERYQTAYEFAVDLREWLKAHATTASSQNVLEALVDLEAPTHPPLPIDRGAGHDLHPEAGATVDLGRRGPRRGTIAPDPDRGPHRASRRARRDPAARGDARRRRAPGPRACRPARSRRRSRASCPGWRWCSRLVAVRRRRLGWFVWKSQQAPVTPPATQAAARPRRPAADHARRPPSRRR